MAGKSDGLVVGGRRIVRKFGTKTQTLNVCTPANQVGAYEVTYRLPIAEELPSSDLEGLADLQALYEYLAARNANPEEPGERVSRLPAPVPVPDKDNSWLATAVAATARAIGVLVDEFMEEPYLHRVEHSLHIRLAELLAKELDGPERVALKTGEVTQLVHKEWPETVPRQRKGVDRPRGAFDLVVLAPEQLGQANLDQFLTGRIDAPIAIEVGLDYGEVHLTQDLGKLPHSSVLAPFVVHFSRVEVKATERDAIEAALLGSSQVACAYVHHQKDGSVRYKHLDGREISVK